MKLEDIKPKAGGIQKRRRVGRGPGSGKGTTGGRGYNGHNARRGTTFKVGFEGGQMPLTRSLPKRGFRNLFRTGCQAVNLGDIDRKASGQSIMDPERMKSLGLIPRVDQLVKILGDGELSIPVTIRAHKFSASALDKIQKANGKADVIEKNTKGAESV